MPTNDYQQFCPTDLGTNLETLVAYGTDPNRTDGNQPGVASSKLNNRALRQANAIAAAFAQFLANSTGDNVLDDANQANLLATMAKALRLPPTITKFLTGSGTYTVPANVTSLRVRMVGGGNGGSGNGSTGGLGTNSSFGTALLVASSGFGLSDGGTATLGTGPIGIAVQGGFGKNGYVTSNEPGFGGDGGSTLLGFGGRGGFLGGAPASAPAANSGGGGGGGSTLLNTTATPGGGGGGSIDCIITPAMACWAATFAYVVGTGGTAGTTGSGGAATAGASGIIVIEEHYN